MTKSAWVKFLLFAVILAVLGIFLLSYIFYWGGSSRDVSVAVNSETPPELTLGGFTPIEGTTYYLAEIYNISSSSLPIYPAARWFPFNSSGWPTRNLVFLDGDTLESRKLFDTNDSLVLSVVPFPEKTPQQGTPPNQAVTPVQWFAYYVVHMDTNNDNLLNEKDLSVLAISDYRGLNYKEIFTNILNLYELTMPEVGRLLAIYKTSEGRFASLIDMRTQEIILNQPLPDLGAEVE